MDGRCFEFFSKSPIHFLKMDKKNVQNRKVGVQHEQKLAPAR